MSKLFRRIVLSAKDLGMEKYSTEEIAEMMMPTENFDQEGLIEFASTVSDIFENKPCLINENKKSNPMVG